MVCVRETICVYNIGGSKGVGGGHSGRTPIEVNFCQIHAIFRKNGQNNRLVLHLWIAPPVTEILDPPLINIGLENVHKTVWKFMLLFLCDIPDRFILKWMIMINLIKNTWTECIWMPLRVKLQLPGSNICWAWSRSWTGTNGGTDSHLASSGSDPRKTTRKSTKFVQFEKKNNWK